MKIGKTEIDIKSLFKRGIKKQDEQFYVRLITGYQGTGKTYLGIYLINQLPKGTTIYTNIHSFKNKQYNIKYFRTIDEITNNQELNEVYLIDEISKKYTKDCKQDKQFYSWLQQSRKRKRKVFLITQEYLQVPTWLRGISLYVYTTSKMPVLPLFITYLGYSELNENLEWVVRPIYTYIYKRNKSIAIQYDTYEPVPTL